MFETFVGLMDVHLFGNPVYQYLFGILVYLSLILALRLFEHMIIRKIKLLVNGDAHKRSTYFIDLFEKTVVPALYFAAFYFSVAQLALAPALARSLYAIWIVVISYKATQLSVALALYFVEEVWIKKRAKPDQTQAFKSILSILRIVIWGVGVVFVLDNLGFNVGAVVAGLGIGGVAVALAAQTILGDLFNYFVIFFDRPFEEGDAIDYDGQVGVIENIGIKSTRIRSLSGEQIITSNSNLTNNKIRNYKRMTERRVFFKIGIVYETPLEKVKQIPAMIRSIIERQKLTRCDRVHLKAFGDYSLDFEIVYYVLNPDYNTHMDIQQNINYEIFEAFQKEGIEFAYPTTVEYLKSLDPAAQKPLD
jgi:small-conductance mechanosensitive channel